MKELLEIPLHQIKAELATRSMLRFWREFVGELIPGDVVEGAYIAYICNELQTHIDNVITGAPAEVDAILVNVPPGTTKSTTISQILQGYVWSRAPWVRFMNVSYAQSISNELAERARDLILSDKYQSYYGDRFTLKDDAKSKTNYKTDKGGQRLSTSTTGTATGIHAHVKIYDDPHKVPDGDKERLGATPAELKAGVDRLKGTFSTRNVGPDTIEICVMQRVSDKDYSADLIARAKKGQIRLLHIKLPANIKPIQYEEEGEVRTIPGFECYPPEAADLYDDDGILEPVRKGKADLIKQYAALGSLGYANQYGQDTTPPEGGLIKRQNWGVYDRSDLPDDYTVNFYIDGAFTSNPDNDPTGIFAYTMQKSSTGKLQMYILGFSKVWLETPEFTKYMYRWVMENGYSKYSRIRIEGKGPGKPWCQMLKRNGVMVDEEAVFLNVYEDKHVQGDKESRAKAYLPFQELGRCLVPSGAHEVKGGETTLMVEGWAAQFIEDCALFPNGKHKEAVDVWSASCKYEFR